MWYDQGYMEGSIPRHLKKYLKKKWPSINTSYAKLAAILEDEGLKKVANIKTRRLKTAGRKTAAYPTYDSEADEMHAHVYVASRSKTAASMAKHIRALQRMFPKSMVQTTEEGGWGSGGIWTSFGEEGVSNYQRAGWPDEHHPKLAAYMDKHGLFGEWNDPGTLMIYHR